MEPRLWFGMWEVKTNCDLVEKLHAMHGWHHIRCRLPPRERGWKRQGWSSSIFARANLGSSKRGRRWRSPFLHWGGLKGSCRWWSWTTNRICHRQWSGKGGGDVGSEGVGSQGISLGYSIDLRSDRWGPRWGMVKLVDMIEVRKGWKNGKRSLKDTIGYTNRTTTSVNNCDRNSMASSSLSSSPSDASSSSAGSRTRQTAGKGFNCHHQKS